MPQHCILVNYLPDQIHFKTNMRLVPFIHLQHKFIIFSAYQSFFVVIINIEFYVLLAGSKQKEIMLVPLRPL
jgi:hypothetical protein